MTEKPTTIYRKDYCPPAFVIESLQLDFDLFDERAVVLATMKIKRIDQAMTTPLVLSGEKLKLLEITLNQHVLPAERYRVHEESLTILELPVQFELAIKTEIHPETNTELVGLYRSGSMFCTQCEAEGFRRITYYLDRPDVMTRFTTVIRADKSKYPVLLSNGNLVANGELEDNRHWVKWEDPFKKPSYLFALVAGDLECLTDKFITQSQREVALHIYVEKGNLHKCQHALDSLKKAMRWDEEQFGREYDLDIFQIVAVSDFNMGAMENKGLNIFNTACALVNVETATDKDFQWVESVIAHEYFHNWTGNRVTCRDWFQLSLKEGLTIFRDQEFSADMHSRALMRIRDVNYLRQFQFPEDAGPMAHSVRPDAYIEIDNFYTTTVYHKGAEVIRMMRTLVGKAGFRKAMDRYFERHDGCAVTIDDLIDAVEDSNKIDLTQFRKWYQYAGTPICSVKTEHDDKNGVYKISVVQDIPDPTGQNQKPTFHIPFSVGLLDAHGNDMPLHLKGSKHLAHGHIMALTERETVLEFLNVFERPVPSFLRNFSAPVKVEYDYKEADLAFLFANDTDHFNRWEAGQTLMKRVILGLIDDYQRDVVFQMPAGLIAAMQKALQLRETEDDLLAASLTLPMEVDFQNLVSEVHIDAIHEAYHFVKQEIANQLHDKWLAVYQDCCSDKPYSNARGAMAKRALQNTCLFHLGSSESFEAISHCTKQYDRSDNMTDTIAALQALIQVECHERDAYLDKFYHKWQQDPLVVDKWFALQASIPFEAVVERVRKLLAHSAYDKHNPNKVRSLLSVFANNPAGFHQDGGEGYELVASQILEMDKLNPQLAARLIRPFMQWRRFEATRREMMELQLKRLRDAKGLSKNVFELVDKCLS